MPIPDRIKRGGNKMSEEPVKTELTFEYKISPTYSMYWVNGAIGGLNPQGAITVNLFSERMAIPKLVTHELKPDGSLGEEISTKGKKYIIRDIVFGLTLTPDVARSIGNWLLKRVEEFEDQIAVRQKKEIS
jgi:hypothetical protein